MKTRLLALVPVAACAAILAGGSGAAAADSTSLISGTVTDFDCGPVHGVGVTSPTRIEVAVTTADISAAVVTQILSPKGEIVARNDAPSDGGAIRYDAYTPGVYAVRVCPGQRTLDEQSISYTGTVTTSAAPARTVGAVAGVQATLRRSATGSGTIRTRHGLATFQVSATNGGRVSLRFDDRVRNVHLRATDASALFGRDTVTIHGAGITLRLVDRAGTRDTVTVNAGSYRTTGIVVRGGLRVR